MTTPLRMPDFDMGSATRREDTSMTQQRPPLGASAARDSEQRYAKLVAETEYKLLEEKARAHEREAKLRDELAKEKAAIPKIVNERVENILRERGMNESAHATATYLAGGEAVATQANTAEVQQLKSQLTDTQRLLADAERRYQQEKRELLNLRTNQLKNETNKRGQEGDIIARAMQVMGEYETIVRSSEENSLARLAHHMESFEAEWTSRSKDFEEKKAEFEMAIMTKALDALKANSKDVDAIGAQIMNKTLELLKGQSQQRLELEQQVLEHSETFKVQYKDILDAEYKERCAAYDQALADRERNLIKIVVEERDKVIGLEKQAVEKAEVSHVQALTDAMAEISVLREQLVKEHQEQQGQAVQDLIQRREQLRQEHNKTIESANERVKKVEKQCFEAVESAQGALKVMQVKLSQREAELSKKLLEHDEDKERARLKEMTEVREDIEAEWKKIVEELRTKHLEELNRVTDEWQERMDKEHTEQFTREQELRRSYEVKMQKMEEATDTRWSKRLQESNRAIERHLEVIDALRDDNEQLNHQISSLHQKITSRENEFASKLAAVQREHEQVWHRKLEEMRGRYDKLLDEALGGPQGESVTRSDHEKVLETLRELEERCVEMKKTEAARMAHERQQLNEMWKERLEQERAERAIWEEDQLKKLSELRIEIEADARRKETETLRRIEQERIRLHDEATKRTVEDRKDRDMFEQRLRDEYHVKVREAEDELNVAYAEKVKVLERRMEEKELEIENRRKELRTEQLQFEERCKTQAEEWLEKEKESILADVKKFHQRLVQDQEKMEEERQAFEQKIAMQYADMFEKAKTDLHASMLDVTTHHTVYWQRCENEWLNFRAEEMGIFYNLRSEHEGKMMEYVQKAAKAARHESEEILQAERETLDKKEADLYAEVEKSRLAQEAASRDRALRLLEERNKVQEVSEKQRAAEEAKLWDELEKKVLAKEKQAEADRRVLEMDLRARYESMINSERSRVDVLMNQHRQEQRELFEKYEQKTRGRDEEWHKQRLAIELEEKNSHEKQYHDLRIQCEKRVAEERQRFEEGLHVREKEFDEERQRILNNLQSQFVDHEKLMKDKMKNIKEDYEKRVSSILQELQQQREQHLVDIGEQERKFQEQRDEYEQESMRRFDRSINDLTGQVEKRAREQQVRELEAKESLEKERRKYEEKINEQYENLLKEHEERLVNYHKERDEKIVNLEQEHQQHLLKVRQDMERSLASYYSQTDGRAKEMADNTRQQFQQKLDEFHGLLAEERRKRIDAESSLQTSREDLESLRSTVEQHKLEVHRSIQAKFEKLFTEMREKTRREKEEIARKSLDEEERRLAKELLRRDADLRKETQDEAMRAWEAKDRHLGGGSGTSSSQQPTAGHTTTAAGYESPSSLYPTGAEQQPPRSTSAAIVPEGEKVTMEVIGKRKEKIQQLWQVMDHPTQARSSFLERLNGMNPQHMLDELNSEIKSLEVQLPLLEVVTRRDFIKHRLQEIERGGNPKQKDDFTKEHQRLTEHLRVEIPKHEQKYGRPFLFRGARFIDLLLSEEEQRATYSQGGGHYGATSQRGYTTPASYMH